MFWDAAEFGRISKDVRAIFLGALFIYEDPKVHTGFEIRSDREAIQSFLESKKKTED